MSQAESGLANYHRFECPQYCFVIGFCPQRRKLTGIIIYVGPTVKRWDKTLKLRGQLNHTLRNQHYGVALLHMYAIRPSLTWVVGFQENTNVTFTMLRTHSVTSKAKRSYRGLVYVISSINSTLAGCFCLLIIILMSQYRFVSEHWACRCGKCDLG